MISKPFTMAVMVVLVAAGTTTIKRSYYDRGAYDIHENGRRTGTVKHDYYDPDAYSVYKEGRRQGPVKRNYYNTDNYRHERATVYE